MIAERDTTVTVQSTVGGNKIEMGIAKEAMAHIMGILTDLYSDPEAAIIREYSTNALDAHAEINLDRPIEVTTPTALHQFFTVRDFGVGLSESEIESIYSQYGASTKRETNDQVGMLGLGCKSALTYTDQFILASVKNGYRIQVAISRDEDGAGYMNVVSRTETSDPSGTLVQVPVKSYNQFETKARSFFRWWQPGTVLVNGVAPRPMDGLRITDDIKLIEANQNYCIMGNVAYPIERSYIQFATGLPSYPSNAIAITVPIGGVAFTPSREALMYTAKTKVTLEQYGKLFKQELPVAIQAEIDKCGSHAEALKLKLRWAHIVKGVLSYKGQVIPTNIKLPSGSRYLRVYGPKGRADEIASINDRDISNACFVINYDEPNFSVTKHKKLELYANTEGLTFSNYVLLKDRLPTPFIQDSQYIDWDNIKDLKLPRKTSAAASSGRLAGSYDLYIDEILKHGVLGADIDQSKPIFYGDKYQCRASHKLLNELYPGCIVVVLGANRVKKFLRDAPTTRHVVNTLLADGKKWWTSLSDTDKLSISLRSQRSGGGLAELDSKKVEDPKLKVAILAATTNVDKLVDKYYMFNSIGLRPSFPDWENPLKKYPLYRGYSVNMDHVYIYMNAVYALDNAAADGTVDS